jgi:hypothetical protein
MYLLSHGFPLSVSNFNLKLQFVNLKLLLQQARASSLTKARLMMHQRQLHLGQEMPQPQVLMSSAHPMSSANPSEKSFGSSLARAENEYYGVPYRLQPNGSRFKSQPTSPLKNVNVADEFSRGNVDLSTHYGFVDRGSNLSLHSQEKQTDFEIQKLRRELAEEHDKVLNLSSQLVRKLYNKIDFFQF